MNIAYFKLSLFLRHESDLSGACSSFRNLARSAKLSRTKRSPAVQADETGWCEDGKNGYIWSINTPTVRYYEYHHSRGSEVMTHLLGERFEGVLGSDFFASYNVYAGLHPFFQCLAMLSQPDP